MTNSTRKIKLTRIPLDRGGYDPNGRYYGVGLPLYRAEDINTEETLEFRARDREDAKKQVDKQNAGFRRRF